MKVKCVFKYVMMPVRDLTTIRLPLGAEALSVHEQYGQLCLWALVDPDEKASTDRTFRIAGTGHNIANGKFKFIGTVLLESGSFVLHVFEALS